MRLADIINGPWAITPAMFAEVQGVYARHMRGEKINLADVEARVGAPLKNTAGEVTVVDGVAVIPIDGVLAKKMNLFMQISGGTSMQIAGNQLRAALDSPDVRAIILHTDSPGGTVDGTQELANAVFAARGAKPIVALADGLMASAAYWIGSAASRVFMAGDTTAVGSIGVVATHTDLSGYEAKQGIKTTEITAGRYKRIASQYEPLTTDGRADIQGKVDQLYSVFVDAVAANRGVSVEQVLKDMADGRVFIGAQAQRAGLVDGVATLDALIARASAGEFSAGGSNKVTVVVSGAGVAPSAETHAEDEDMNDLTVDVVKAKHPEIATALIAEGQTQGHTAGRAEGVTAGAAAELARIKSVEEQALPGHEKLIEELKFDGKTTGEQAAVAVLNAERAKRGTRLADMKDDAADAGKVTSTTPATGKPAEQAAAASPHQVAALARTYQDEQKAAGHVVSPAEAVAHVTQELEAKSKQPA